MYLLLATLVPIIKDKLGSISTSKNYHSIAISRLVLKLFDRITLHLFDKKLGLDDLQFAYQENASTTMCSWMVSETINYFLERGKVVMFMPVVWIIRKRSTAFYMVSCSANY